MRRALVLSLSVICFGCNTQVGTAPSDAGAPADAGTTDDAASSTTVDTGAASSDAGLLDDTGIRADSGSAADAGVQRDAGAPRDAGVRADTGSAADTGTAGVDAGGLPTAAELLARLGTCTRLPGTTNFANDSGGTPTVPMCTDTGVLWFTADMDIDCDGGRTAACMADPYYQAGTSCVDSGGRALDASTLPFIVLPLDSNGFTVAGAGIRCGQVAAVIYRGQVMYGILGDRGPRGGIGEGSYAMAAALGINPNPVSGGIGSGVTYVVFTGAGPRVTRNEDHAEAVRIGTASANTLLGR